MKYYIILWSLLESIRWHTGRAQAGTQKAYSKCVFIYISIVSLSCDTHSNSAVPLVSICMTSSSLPCVCVWVYLRRKFSTLESRFARNIENNKDHSSSSSLRICCGPCIEQTLDAVLRFRVDCVALAKVKIPRHTENPTTFFSPPLPSHISTATWNVTVSANARDVCQSVGNINERLKRTLLEHQKDFRRSVMRSIWCVVQYVAFIMSCFIKYCCCCCCFDHFWLMYDEFKNHLFMTIWRRMR